MITLSVIGIVFASAALICRVSYVPRPAAELFTLAALLTFCVLMFKLITLT